MKFAIQKKNNSFSKRWIKYCEENSIPFKVVNCYASDIIQQLHDCDALLWHFSHIDARDYLFAKQLLFSVDKMGLKVFPDFNTCWHFDDKVGQKYLLESIQAPFVNTLVFYNKNDALEAVKKMNFPKVFKLRKGAGSSSVKLIKNKKEAKKIIKIAFGRGFNTYDKFGSIQERWYQYTRGNQNFTSVLKGLLRIFRPTYFSRVVGREKGYVYFQEFIKNNDHDIRVVVIDGKAFAIKRMVRHNDFRASGSGEKYFERELFEKDLINLSFNLADKLKMQSVAFDFVYSGSKPLIVEISYGFMTTKINGYWDRDLHWHTGHFHAEDWMIETLLKC